MGSSHPVREAVAQPLLGLVRVEAGDADALDRGVAWRRVAGVEVEHRPGRTRRAASRPRTVNPATLAPSLSATRVTRARRRGRVSRPSGPAGPGVPLAIRKNSVPQISLPLLLESAKNGPSTAICVRWALSASILACGVVVGLDPRGEGVVLDHEGRQVVGVHPLEGGGVARLAQVAQTLADPGWPTSRPSRPWRCRGPRPRSRPVGRHGGQRGGVRRDPVGLDVVGVAVAAELVVGDQHLRPDLADDLDEVAGRLGEVGVPEGVRVHVVGRRPRGRPRATACRSRGSA